MAARALRAGGVLVCYVPTAIQLGDTVAALERDGGFGEVESFETLLRNWHVKGSERAPGASDGRALGLHHRVAPPGLVLAGRRRAASCAGRIAGQLDDDASVADARRRYPTTATPTTSEADARR